MADIDWVGHWGQSNQPRTDNGLRVLLLDHLGPDYVHHDRWSGGQSIQRWMLEDCTPGALYQSYIDELTGTINAIIDAGDTPIPRAFYWTQGEADAVQLDRAENYYDRLCCLQKSVLDQIELLTGIRPPFIFMITRNETVVPFTDSETGITEELVPAQINVYLNSEMKRAAKDHGLIYVESNDANRVDEVHLAGGGDVLVEQRYYDAFLSLQSYPDESVCPDMTVASAACSGK